MKYKVNWFRMAAGLAVAVLFLLGLDRADRTATYIESCQMNLDAAESIAVMDKETVLSQEFVMPYELFSGISVKTGTFGRNNHSFWDIGIIEKENGKSIFSRRFNASQINDGEYYAFTADKAIRVKQGQKYILSIQAKEVTGNSALAFYTSAEDVYAGGGLYLNGEALASDLCFEVFGGEKDAFWPGLYLVLTASAVWLAVCLYRRNKRGIKPKEDELLFAVFTCLLYLFLTYLFTRLNMGTFTDECDNIRGGMLIAKGKVLYRDYYAQHTPFA